MIDIAIGDEDGGDRRIPQRLGPLERLGPPVDASHPLP